jgi:hypothetical protein
VLFYFSDPDVNRLEAGRLQLLRAGEIKVHHGHLPSVPDRRHCVCSKVCKASTSSCTISTCPAFWIDVTTYTVFVCVCVCVCVVP